MTVAARFTIGLVSALILLTSTSSASAQEPTGPSGEPPCAPFHGDPPVYRPGATVERAVQRLMRPLSDGTQRSPRAISTALRRAGLNVGYAERPQDVPPYRVAVVREGTNLTTTVVVRTILLVSGVLCPGNGVDQVRHTPYNTRYAVRAASRMQLVPARCLARNVARPAGLPRAYLSAARSLLRSGLRSPRLIAALLTRQGYPTLPVATVSDMSADGLSLVLDRSRRRQLTVGYKRVTCPSSDRASKLVTRLRSIR